MHGVYRYSLGWMPPELRTSLAAIPGVTLRGQREVFAPVNAAWLVEEGCNRHGVRFAVNVVTKPPDGIRSVDELVERGLREWVPAFLTPYQREGVVAMSRQSGMLLWAAGSGKTLGGVCWALGNGGATVVVTRAAVRRAYGREIERFTTHRAYVVEDTGPLDADRLEAATFVVLGWETVPAHIDALLAWKPTNVIFDEIHKAKSNKRFEAVPREDGSLSFKSRDNIAYNAYVLSRAVKYRLGTTATPIKDRTRDLWAELDLVQPDAWGPFYRHDRPSFTGRYCAARRNAFGGVDTSGASNLDELWNRVSLSVHQVPYSVTHRDLPQRRRVVTFIPTSEQSAPSGGFAKELAKASKTGKTAILEVRLAEAASRKRAAIVERVEECVEAGQKVLIFTGRRNDCDKLADAVRKAIEGKGRVYSGHGGTPAKERDGIQQAYMSDPGPCVLVGTGDAWGEGVNLQDTDTFLIAMLPFTPGQVVQWEGRVARHGQKRPVLIEYMVAENTVDEHVAAILLDKLPAVEEVAKDDSVVGFADSLMGGDKTEEEIIESVLAMLEVA